MIPKKTRESLWYVKSMLSMLFHVILMLSMKPGNPYSMLSMLLFLILYIYMYIYIGFLLKKPLF